MHREAVSDSRHEILRAAARLFHRKGYDATSMSDVASAMRLSKGGLYHHFLSKDEILFSLMDQAMELTQKRVIEPVSGIANPEERLRMLIQLHVELVLSPKDREITVMLHENHPLPPSLRRKINRRKKDYVHFVENLVTDIQRLRRSTNVINPRAATFALLGMINWIYQWYRPEGRLDARQLAHQYTDIFFSGAFHEPRKFVKEPSP